LLIELQQAVEEVKLIKAGAMKDRAAREFLNEI